MTLINLQPPNYRIYPHTEMETCPYSKPPYGEFTDDHIFSLFLGGRRTIRVCRQCNNIFGHTFEGRASNQLKRLQVFISQLGLDLTRTLATWPAALEIGDDTFDLLSGPEGVQYVLGKPTIRRDAEGKIVSGKARSMAEAKQIAKGLIKSGQAKDVDIFTSDDSPIDDVRLTAPLSLNPDLYRLATKMAAAVLVSFDRANLVAESGIPAYLRKKGDWPTGPAYCDVESIRQMRPPLAYAIYVELGEASYAVVLLFGFHKIFIPLPAASPVQAFLGSLDPMTGEERFLEVAPVGPRSVPPFITETQALGHLQDINDAVTREAIMRGAKHPPKLEIEKLDLGVPADASWADGTVRYMFPQIIKRET
jgi:HNH endonuclease